MYKTINAVLAFAVMLALLCGAVLWGAYKGWSGERQQVESSMDTLHDMLRARKEIGNNILTVARRHLDADDVLLLALREDLDQLTGRHGFEKLAAVNQRFEADAEALLERLCAQPSLQADERDSMYANSMLPQALEQSARMTEQAEYNRQAAEFNQSMENRFSGRIARFLGVEMAQQFIVTQEGAQ